MFIFVVITFKLNAGQHPNNISSWV